MEMTPSKLQNYVKDYDYEINLNQAKQVLEVLNVYFGVYLTNDIIHATDYIVNFLDSEYAWEFN